MTTHIAHFTRTAIVLLCVALCGTAVAQTASMETRLRNLEGEPEIRRSLDDYMHLLRTRDWDNYIKLFATDSAIDIVSEAENGSFRVRGSGIYSDTWVRENGVWLIKYRKVDRDLLAGAGRATAPASPASKPAK